ncbi:MAG: hypothetical protein ACI8W3_002479 [Myxococcota bacterium]|jgi:hypothetical protein
MSESDRVEVKPSVPGEPLEQAIEQANQQDFAKGPPPLASFGLVLHHDASWTHEGHAFRNRKLKNLFDRSVRYLPDEGGVYVVQIGHFRGLVDVEESGFFVDDIDLVKGQVLLSDKSSDKLEVATLAISPIDGALLCRVKTDLDRDGVQARFSHAVQAEFLNAVDDDGATVIVGGKRVALPPL